MTALPVLGHTARIDDIDLHYLDTGVGSPLLLLHGFTGSSADWAHLFDLGALARDHRLVIPDLRGHGRSTDPARASTIRRAAMDVLGLLDRLEIDRVRAIGLSLGANVLLHLATRAPERVLAMVIVSATPYFPAQARPLMRAMAEREPSPEELATLRASHAHGDEQIRALRTIAGRFADGHDDMAFTPPLLATIAARTLIVQGDRDPLYPVELSVDLHRSIPRASLWIVPDAGHVPVLGEAREPFARKALAFLGS